MSQLPNEPTNKYLAGQSVWLIGTLVHWLIDELWLNEFS